MNLSAQRCLVIPDVHQDIAWVERILAREPEADLVVFLGDYFDSRRSPEERAGVVETCVYLDALRVRLGERGVFLLGNHDVQYFEARAACLAQRTPRHLRYKCGPSFIPSAAKQIAKTLAPEFWSASRLFVNVNGWLLSHAGVAPVHWPARGTLAESLGALEQACAIALQSLAAPGVFRAAHPLLQAGYVRGGDTPVGGLTWLDWDHEFEDALPTPQIVGHTVSALGARQSGRSLCLDGGQTCYGVLEAGELRVREA
ncbi:MAG: metallophosphoesterase [Burkholderiales bacterium]|nr:metallophosphoesterase [Opitutaceae bacterium]